MPSPSPTQRSLRRRILFVAIPVVTISIFLVVGIPFAVGALFIRTVTMGITGAGCGPDTPPGTYDLPYEDVAFRSSELNRDIRGYFIPGTNGVTLIDPPTGNNGNGNIMQEVAVLNRHGYGVLTYVSRGCLGFPYHTLGYAEVAEVKDAMDYLATRDDVDMTRLGIHGFSTAGATAIFAAARYPELRAVVAEGNYHDFDGHTANQISGAWYSGLYLLGVRLGYRAVTGLDIAVLSPVSVIHEIAPRPILLIYGSIEPALYGGRLEQAAAGDNAELWEVPGSWHGGYVYAAPEAFERRVIGFYDRAFGVGDGS